jgi:hypothetical protein
VQASHLDETEASTLLIIKAGDVCNEGVDRVVVSLLELALYELAVVRA